MENFKDITREELKKWIDEKKDFVLLDVLPEGSYEARHLPGAKNAPAKEPDFLQKVENLAPDKEKTVIVYCSSFSCQLSPLAADKLSGAGYTQVYDFKGGLADWQDGGYSFEGEAAEEKIKEQYKCKTCSSISTVPGGCCSASQEKLCGCGSEQVAKECCED